MGWERRRGRVRPFVDGNAWAIPRPRITVDWIDDETVLVDLTIGNGNSDPIIAVGAYVRLPERLARLIT